MNSEVQTIGEQPDPAKVSASAVEYGFWIFIVIAVGRVNELIPGLSALPLAKISIGFALVSLFRKWAERPRLVESLRPMASTIKWLFALVVILSPFSVWPGASLQFLLQQFPSLLATMLIGYVMCRTWSSVRGTLFALVVSGVILARAALTGYSGGRAATDTMYDTNDLAYVLVILFPVAIGFAINAQTKWKRIAYIGVAASFLVAVLLTQSRGGLLGILAVGALMVLLPMRPPARQSQEGGVVRNRRFAAILVIVCLGAVIWPQLPDATRTRLETVLNLRADYNLDPNDVNGRSRIWARGWQAAKDRPLGYGPGSFPLVDARYGGRFNTAHNSFLLVLVETGFVGLVLFLRLYFLAWRGLGRLRRDLLSQPGLSSEGRERYVYAGMLRCSLVGSAVAGFFLSMAWVTVLWILFALCMAIVACETEPSEPALEPVEPDFDRVGSG